MATVKDGKLIEFNIQMSDKQPIIGNIYKGIVLKVERGLQAAFVNYGGKRDGFLPLRDVSEEYLTEEPGKEGRRILKAGQEILVQVLREVTGQKGALLTSYISLPGRYLVLLPNKSSCGVSRKIENESDRKRLKEIVEQIKKEDGVGFIVRTAGLNCTKQELARDYRRLLRLWQEIQKKAKTTPAPALIYEESDFGIISLRDYLTPEITEIWVDDPETYKIMRGYLKAIAPRSVDMIKLYKEKTPIFDKYGLEEQIKTIYQDRVELKSGGYIVIKPTEAMTTIDVNSGKASNKRNIEETAFRTNIEAAEEIARQLRLRDIGGLIAIDFIDMMDKKNIAEVERTFRKAVSQDRARIQLARISKFGILELSRQKKHSNIQEISYSICPHCQGRGTRPSLEYTALSAFRKIESQAVKGIYSQLVVSLPQEVAYYLLNQKRSELSKLEANYGMSILIDPQEKMVWDEIAINATKKSSIEDIARGEGKKLKEVAPFMEPKEGREEKEVTVLPTVMEEELACSESVIEEPAKKKTRRRHRGRRKKTLPSPEIVTQAEAVVETIQEVEIIAPAGEIVVEEQKKHSSRRRRRRKSLPAEGTSQEEMVGQEEATH